MRQTSPVVRPKKSHSPRYRAGFFYAARVCLAMALLGVTAFLVVYLPQSLDVLNDTLAVYGVDFSIGTFLLDVVLRPSLVFLGACLSWYADTALKNWQNFVLHHQVLAEPVVASVSGPGLPSPHSLRVVTPSELIEDNYVVGHLGGDKQPIKQNAPLCGLSKDGRVVSRRDYSGNQLFTWVTKLHGRGYAFVGNVMPNSILWLWNALVPKKGAQGALRRQDSVRRALGFSQPSLFLLGVAAQAGASNRALSTLKIAYSGPDDLSGGYGNKPLASRLPGWEAWVKSSCQEMPGRLSVWPKSDNRAFDSQAGHKEVEETTWQKAGHAFERLYAFNPSGQDKEPSFWLPVLVDYLQKITPVSRELDAPIDQALFGDVGCVSTVPQQDPFQKYVRALTAGRQNYTDRVDPNAEGGRQDNPGEFEELHATVCSVVRHILDDPGAGEASQENNFTVPVAKQNSGTSPVKQLIATWQQRVETNDVSGAASGALISTKRKRESGKQNPPEQGNGYGRSVKLKDSSRRNAGDENKRPNLPGRVPFPF